MPEALLASQLGRAPFSPGGQFFCNFYKISESPDIEHYASFSPVDSEKPNFHLPECFARAVLV
ncbi:carbohydrate-binding family 9-like protein [Anaerotruncus colihominis]|uniref:carbohydrate-binding family 9-like protein n=1 Tax=Anaerotruncus colihominis TaxID=169435 RepID=UPI0039938A30